MQPITNQSTANQPNVNNSINSQKVKTPKPKWLKALMIAIPSILVALVLFIIGITLIVNHSTRNAVKVSNTIVDSLQANDASTIIRLEATSFSSDGTTDDDIRNMVEALSPQVQGEEKIIAKHIESLNGQTSAAIVYSVTPANSSTIYIKITLTKESDVWKFARIDTSATKLDDSIN